MKTALKEPEQERAQPFQKVAECLYRHASGTYYGLVKRGGKQIRRSLKTTDRLLAVRRLAEFRGKVSRLTETGAAGKIRFEELAARWLESTRMTLKPNSARGRGIMVRNLGHHFGGKLVRGISVRDCEDWASARAAKVSASTYNSERGTLTAILALAKRDGLILDNPAEHTARRKMERAALQIPTRAQFLRLVEAMRGLDARALPGVDLVELLAYSGMRLGEGTAVSWGDIDWQGERFVVTGGEQGTKNHEARSVPLFPALRALLERLRGETTQPANERVIPIATAKKALASACRKAGLPDFGHHAMRHYFVSNAIEAGVDFKTIAAWVGHKDGGVLVAKTYGHLRDVHSTEMAKRMTFTANQP